MQAETAAVVPQDAIQAASGAAKSQAGIPYIGHILAVAAMGAMMAAVMGLMGGWGRKHDNHINPLAFCRWRLGYSRWHQPAYAVA